MRSRKQHNGQGLLQLYTITALAVAIISLEVAKKLNLKLSDAKQQDFVPQFYRKAIAMRWTSLYWWLSACQRLDIW